MYRAFRSFRLQPPPAPLPPLFVPFSFQRGQVTATAVMQLVERGALDLDADVRTHVPAWPEKPEGAVTLRHLLTHQSGIPHYGRGALAYDDLRHYASRSEERRV